MVNLTAAVPADVRAGADNRTQLKPALDKVNGVLDILDNRKQELQRALYLLRRYAMSFGEVLGRGPVHSSRPHLVNLLPGQFAPAVHRRRILRFGPGPECVAAVAARGPRRRSTRHPRTSDALPADRPGRRTTPESARRDHRQPR